jgi:gliding motility-associated-like protein
LLLVKVYNKVVLIGLFISLLSCLSFNAKAQCSGADFKSTQPKGCVPWAVTFTATGFPSGSTFRWDLGNGYINWTDTITKLYTFPGKYKIKMEVTSPGGSSPCAIIIKDTFITILPSPVPQMWVTPGITICNRSDYALFTDTTANEISREWIIEGNSFKDAQTAYVFATPGTKQVILKVMNKYLCRGLQSQNINVFDSVKVDVCGQFIIDQNSSNAPVKAILNAGVGNTNGRTISGYSWQFPGGTPSTSTVKNPVVVYPDNTKKYDVTLAVTMTDGCTYTIFRKGFISPFLSPVFQNKCANEPIPFTADLSDTGRHFYSFNFPSASGVDFGNPPPPDPKSGKVTYTSAGNFGASFTYKYKGLGCAIKASYANYVTITGPLADFTSTDHQICKGTDTVHFINKSNTLGAPNVKYTWYIFDSTGKLLKRRNRLGPTSTADTFYSPGVAGKYGVGLVATSTNGCKDSTVYKPLYITVGSPKSDFVSGTKIGCYLGSVILTAKPNPPEGKVIVYNYAWNVKSDVDTTNVSKGTGNVYSFSPPILGSYTVKLTISNGHCQSDSTKKAFFTAIGDVTNMTIDQTSGCLSPNFITTVGVSKEKLYPDDPSDPPIYHWRTENADISNVTFLYPYDRSTPVVITKSGCYNIFLDIFTHVGTDTCKMTLSRKGPAGICVGAGVSFYEDPFKCIGDTITINNNSNPLVKNFKWSVSPPQYAQIIPSDTARDIKIIFKKDVCYKIVLKGERVVAGSLCRDSFVDDNLCLIQPKADFTTSTPTFYCAPAIGRFKSTSSNATSYLWRFDDGDSILTPSDSIAHAYLTLKKSSYNIKLTAFDTHGCSNTVTKNNVIKVAGPVPHFTVDKREGCDSLTVNFKNTSSKVNSFYFFFDDASAVLSNKNPGKHTYILQDPALDSAVFYPTILSRDDTLCKVFYRDTLKLYRTPLNTKIVPDVSFGCVPLTVHFNAVSRTANDWRWDFDGTGVKDSTHKAPVFKFTKYVVKLTVRNHKQCPVTIYSDTIYVIPNAKAGYNPSATTFCGKQQISFKNTTINYKRFVFDYGDGTPWDSNVIARHTYIFDATRISGDSVQYISRLIAYNAAGCSDTFKKTITGYILPVGGFKSSVVAGCSPLKVHFTDTSKNSFGAEWDFDNDGVIDAYGKLADWTFSPGIYTVKLRSFSKHGCIDSVVKVNMIYVNDPPKADFSVSDSVVCYKGEVHFTNLTAPAAEVKQWLWKFTDPGAPYYSSTQKEPTFRFYAKGYHAVELIAIDDKGCSSSSIKKHAVYVADTLPPPNSNLVFVTVKDTHSVLVTWRKNSSVLFKAYKINRLENGKAVVIYAPQNESDTTFTDTDNKINTSGQSYCYSMQTTNACDRVSFASYSHCTILLNETALPGPANVLDWNSYRGWQPNYYRIYRAGAGGAMKKIDSVGGGTLTYTDSALCDETYCYYVEAVKDSGITSKSNTTCLHALYVHLSSPLNLRYVTDWNEKQVKLLWDTTGYKNLNYYAIDKYSAYTGWINNYATTKTNFFIDDKVDINNITYNYRVKAVDKCDYENQTSNTGSSILVNQGVNKDNVELHWNKYTNWAAGVKNYNVQIQLKNKTYKTIASVTDSTYTDNAVYSTLDTAYCYRVIAYANPTGQDSSISNRACAVLPSRIYIPNAFSPGNHDSLNDTWKISPVSIYNAVGSKLHGFDAKVFNRWGMLVFETRDLDKGWDGRFQGNVVPADVYIYLIDAEGIDGKNIHLKGNVTVVK